MDTHPLSLTHTHTHTHSLSLTHTHIDTHTHMDTHTHTRRLPPKLFLFTYIIETLGGALPCLP